MAKRTILLLIFVLVLLSIVAAVCVLLVLRDNGLMGSGVYFVKGGMGI